MSPTTIVRRLDTSTTIANIPTTAQPTATKRSGGREIVCICSICIHFAVKTVSLEYIVDTHYLLPK